MHYQNIKVGHPLTAQSSNIIYSRTTQIKVSTMHYKNIHVYHPLTAQSSNIRYSWTTQIKVSIMRNQYINVVHLIQHKKYNNKLTNKQFCATPNYQQFGMQFGVD